MTPIGPLPTKVVGGDHTDEDQTEEIDEENRAVREVLKTFDGPGDAHLFLR